MDWKTAFRKLVRGGAESGSEHGSARDATTEPEARPEEPVVAPVQPVVQAESAPEPSGPPAWLDEYRRWLVDLVGSVHILDMTEARPLIDLYIPMNLAVPSNPAPDTDVVERRFVEVDEQAVMDAGWRNSGRSPTMEPGVALSEYGRVAVVGDPGAGKTTLLRRLALQLAQSDDGALPNLPFVVDLHSAGHGDLFGEVQPERVFPAWLASRIEQHVPKATSIEAWITERFESGEAVLLLDGLDEVADAADDESNVLHNVMHALAATEAAYPNLPILVTCRRGHIGRYVNLPKSFTILETQDFEWEHVCRFIDAWFRSSPETGDALTAQLQRNVRIRGLASNPLLLALVCIIFQRRGSLPQRRADVYRRCVDVLLAEWDATRRKDRYARFTLEHKEDLLRRIAWHFHRYGQRYVKHDELIELIAAFLPMIRLKETDAQAILDEISTYHGLLKEYGQGWYGFHHFTLQEHFAVEQITSWQRLDEAIALRNRTWWREIIRLYAGKGDCTGLVVRLATEREDIFNGNLLLMGQCLTEGSAVEPNLLDSVRDELTRLARMQTRAPDTRSRAAVLVMRLISDTDVDALSRFLADGRITVGGRLTSVRNATFPRIQKVRAGLMHLLADSSVDIAVREALATAFGAEAGQDELERLTGTITMNTDAAARQRLALALGQGRIVGTEPLREIVQSRTADQAVREGLAISIGYTSRIDGVLRPGNDTPEGVRAALAIGRLLGGDMESLPEIRSTVRSEDTDPWLRRQAIGALMLRDRNSTSDLLLDLLSDTAQDRSNRVYAARLLGNTATGQPLADLLALVRDESVDRFVRVAIMEGLGEARDPSVTPALVSIAMDVRALEYIRRGAIDALGPLGDADAVDPLTKIWRDSTDARLRGRAIVAIGRIGAERTLLETVNVLNDRDVDRGVRRSLAEVIRPYGSSVDALVLDRVCEWLGTTDIPSALLSVVGRFASEIGRTIYPEELDLPPIKYGL